MEVPGINPHKFGENRRDGRLMNRFHHPNTCRRIFRQSDNQRGAAYYVIWPPPHPCHIFFLLSKSFKVFQSKSPVSFTATYTYMSHTPTISSITDKQWVKNQSVKAEGQPLLVLLLVLLAPPPLLLLKLPPLLPPAVLSRRQPTTSASKIPSKTSSETTTWRSSQNRSRTRRHLRTSLLMRRLRSKVRRKGIWGVEGTVRLCWSVGGVRSSASQRNPDRIICSLWGF